MKYASVFLLMALLFSGLWAQETEAQKNKWIMFNTEMKPYVEGGYFLTDEYVLTGGFGFYRDGNMDKTFFMLKAGLNKFLQGRGPVRLFAGGYFQYEANPGVVYGGNLDSRVTLSGTVGGWLRMTSSIYLNGQINLGLDFTNSQNALGKDDNAVNFGFTTSSIGILLLF